MEVSPTAKRIAIVGTHHHTLLCFRDELIKDLVKAGYTVFAFCIDHNQASRERTRELGAEPVDYHMQEVGLNPIRDLQSMFQLKRLFKQYDIDISYCFFAKPAIYGTTAAWLAGVPKRVAKLEGLGRVFVGNSKYKKLLRLVMVMMYKFSLSKADLLLLLNPDDKRDLVDQFNIKAKRTVVLGGIGVCLEQYFVQPAPTDKVRFIFVGRLLAEKGIRYFLSAAKELRNRYGDGVEFIVLGGPDDSQQKSGGVNRQELEGLIEKGVLTYPGMVTDVRPWLARSNVFVLPSFYREGVPRSTQEALAMGRAVITTDMPGCRETVEHGVTGLMVAPRNQRALTEAMATFVKQPRLASTMGCEGRKLAERKFNVRIINEQIIALIKHSD